MEVTVNRCNYLLQILLIEPISYERLSIYPILAESNEAEPQQRRPRVSGRPAVIHSRVVRRRRHHQTALFKRTPSGKIYLKPS